MHQHLSYEAELQYDVMLNSIQDNRHGVKHCTGRAYNLDAKESNEVVARYYAVL